MKQLAVVWNLAHVYPLFTRWKHTQILRHAAGAKLVQNYDLLHDTGPVASSTIPAQCCAIPFTLNGAVHRSCVDDGGGGGCFYGDREWKLCQQPAGKRNRRWDMIMTNNWRSVILSATKHPVKNVRGRPRVWAAHTQLLKMQTSSGQ